MLHDWKNCLVSDLPEKRGACYLGVDLGGATSLSAATAFFPETGRMDVYGGVPTVPDLKTRGKADTVGGLYVQMHQRGELYLSPGRVVDAGDFLKHVFALIDWPIHVAGADFYRKSEVLQAFEDCAIYPRIEFRSGKDGGQDIRAFQRAVMTERIRTAENLLMLMCLRNSEVRYDGDHAKLVKTRQHGRIDACSAAVISCGLAETHPVKTGGYRVLTVG